MIVKRDGKYVYDGTISFDGEPIILWRSFDVTFSIDGIDLIVAIHDNGVPLDFVVHHGAAANWHTPYKQAQEAIDHLIADNIETLTSGDYNKVD